MILESRPFNILETTIEDKQSPIDIDLTEEYDEGVMKDIKLFR